MQDLVKDRLAHLSAEKRALLALRLSRSQGGRTVAAAPSDSDLTGSPAMSRFR
jgi:hypothetical protein